MVLIYLSRFKRVGVIFLKELKMLVLSLLFVALIVLLIFCLTKDKGENTIHARKDNEFSNTSVSVYRSNKKQTSIDSDETAEIN